MKKVILLLILFISSAGLKAQLSSEEALAMQYFQSGDFEKAALLYEKLFNRTKNSSYYDPYINSLLKLKQFTEAEKLSRSLLKSNPGNFTYSVDIGRIYQEKGEQEKASEWFNTLIRTMPANEFAIKDLAITFYRAEAYDFSVKAFLTGRKLLNKDNAFTYDLLSLYRFRKDKIMLIQEYINLLSTNPEALPQAQNVLGNILESKDDFDMLRSSILRRLQKEPQSIVMTEFLTWQFIQQKDFDMALRQTLALDRRLKEDGSRVFELSRLLVSNQAFDQAIESLNYLVSKGASGRYYLPAKIDLLNVKTRQLTSLKFSKEDLITIENDFNSLLNEFGRSSGTAFAIRQLANLQAYYLEKPAVAAQQLQKLLELPGLPPHIIGQTKSELGDIYILTGEVWEAALLYGQIEKAYANEPLGQEARFKSAKLAYYQGDFVWAKAQLDVLKGSTSQLIANDALNLSLLISDNLQSETDTAALKKYADADLMIFKNRSDKALLILDSINVLYPGNSLADDILMAKSKIFIKNNTLNQAIDQLMGIIENYPSELWGDDAVFILADIYETRLNQPVKALELYQKIITDFPGSLYVIEARKRFRKLRGDKLG
ncbi:Tetratricopeptide repeat-containing protein [Daejeonella rubra]|uniref:Tetratricopeptide repeat-containing protein n=1 Tax=Daejeonella rubra TaxID=990371 RepID=A0A1G9U3S2_9SPHI|nr:tetratricopeptide repeat protein [Daejeonella rubra]SDM54629.1 Tetratricopeptide repeat-containing protein [Daejeonella rubra]